ncbi:hypothetical protein HRO20_003060 [Vibrio cholerae]|nr:hypothetical protein [Vibrio cholerae]
MLKATEEMGEVAPPAGAWIETANGSYRAKPRPSRLPQARGLKPEITVNEIQITQVAPPAGAWIETNQANGNPDIL